MFGVDSSELAVIAVLALVLIGPKDLPRVMRTIGQWVSEIRGTARHFKTGLKNMVREAELEEMEKKWREENERIMSLHPPEAYYPEPGTLDERPPIGQAEPEGEELPAEKRPLP